MTWSSRGGQALATIAAYCLASLLSLGLAAWALDLRQAELGIPFCYRNDGLNNLMVIKAVIDHGWYLHNPSLGTPYGLNMEDYPFVDPLALLVMKLLGLVHPECAVVGNVYFLLTFPLTAVTAMLVFRQFGFSYGAALVASVLYALAPFHFLQGELHLFIASYYTVPLILMVLLWVFQDQVAICPPGDVRADGRRTLAGICIGLLTAATMIYYAFFACYLLLVTGLASSVYRRRWYPLATTGILIAVILAGCLAVLSPNLIYRLRHGPNPQTTRQPTEAEWNGMKMTQLLLPVTGHRLESWAKFKARYNQDSPLVNENDTSSLGLIGSLGFLLLIGRLLWKRSSSERLPMLDGLSVLNIFAVLLGTMGGLGALFNLFVSAWIRSYNRISIWIAFLSLFALFWTLEQAARVWASGAKARWLYQGLLGLILGIGLWDQASRLAVPPYAQWKKDYESDAAFVRQIEESVQPQARIFQLPAMAYPENGMIEGMDSFDHLRGYLHARTLRWSFATMRGRKGDWWQNDVAKRPPPALVAALSQAGFSGIYLDREAYADRGAKLEKEFMTLLHTPPVVSANEKLAFFPLQTYNMAR